jgi:hypothetical protein
MLSPAIRSINGTETGMDRPSRKELLMSENSASVSATFVHAEEICNVSASQLPSPNKSTYHWWIKEVSLVDSFGVSRFDPGPRVAQ